MTYQLAAAAPRISRWKAWQQDLGLAFAVAAAVVLVHAARGFPLIFGPNADNDSLMRMIEVLDFLSGQGWYDLHQYRMGPEGGFLMHWSRFVDVPIAALLLLSKALTGSMESAQTVVEILYPALLMTAAMFLLLRFVRRLGNAEALLPTTIIGALALYDLPLFQGAALDHHNIQLVLVLASILLLMPGNGRPLEKFGAGTAAALSLVVGMETAPYVAVAGLVAAISFLLRGDREHRAAAAFGAGFAGISLLSFLGAVPWSLWGVPHCDAFSLPQMSVAALGGTGLLIAALVPACRATFGKRLLCLAVLAAALAALLVLAFPECLSAPYADLDPRLQAYWIDSVSEAQSIRQVLAAQPAAASAYYCTPLLAAFLLALRLRREGLSREGLVYGTFLLAAIGVSFWQIRGVFFSIPLSVVPLAVWVGKWRARIASQPEKGGTLKLLSAWLVSFNVVWSVTVQSAAGMIFPASAAGGADTKESCVSRHDYAILAAMPNTTVLAISNLGAPILRYTSQRALSGPYHRNGAGGLAMLEALTGTDAEAHDIVRRYGITIVASCPGNAETKDLQHRAPDGLAARLARGDVPAWLAPVPSTMDQPLKLYRVVTR